MGNTLTFKTLHEQVSTNETLTQEKWQEFMGKFMGKFMYGPSYTPPALVPWPELDGPSERVNSASFTLQQRIRALRSAAAWCEDGAPGGSPRRLFSPAGPCALGKVLLELHPVVRDWVKDSELTCGVENAIDAIIGLGATDYDDPRVVRANTHLAEVANVFDAGMLDLAALRLETAADLLQDMLDRPHAKELTDSQLRTPVLMAAYEEDDGYLVEFKLETSQQKPHAVLTPA